MTKRPTYEELEERVNDLKAQLAASRDISEVKRSEEALLESEQHLRDTIDFLPDATFAIDLEGRVTSWNRAIEEMTGIKAEDMLGKGDYEYAIPFYQTRRPIMIDLVLRPDKEMEKEYPYLIKEKDVFVSEAIDLFVQGNLLTLWAKASPIYDAEGNVIGAIESIRDITDRKRMELALMEEKERFRVLVEESPYGVSIVSKGGDYRYLNPRFTGIFGYTLEDIPTGREWFRKAFPDKGYRTQVISTWVEDVEEHEVGEFRPRTFHVRCKDGSEKVIHFRSVTMAQSRDQFVTYEDVTERERLQSRLFGAQKMEAIGTLAGGIAHLFNNALVAITGYTGLLEMNYRENREIVDYADKMKESAHRMSQWTGQLLAYARGGRYQPEVLSLCDLVRDTIPVIRPSLKPGIEIDTDLSRDVLYVDADASQMQMILSAIVFNSNDAIEDEGRIRIGVRNEEVKPGHPEVSPGTYVCLSVMDDGRGMDEETRNRIFDPFFTTHFIGRGLGMAAVYGIVRNHGGRISIESEPGKGTVVRIYLPGVTALPEEEEPVLEPLPGLGIEEGTILVIDDEEDIIHITQKALEMLGYKVLVAMTGREALEITKGHEGEIDLCLLDIKLPDIMGDGLYPMIMEARPGLRVIVFSGYSIEGPAQEILDAGAQAFLQKPFTISAMAQKIREVLAGK
jgi:two-component system cell cycle sensor histidine kinase/response regulator CckA